MTSSDIQRQYAQAAKRTLMRNRETTVKGLKYAFLEDSVSGVITLLMEAGVMVDVFDAFVDGARDRVKELDKS